MTSRTRAFAVLVALAAAVSSATAAPIRVGILKGTSSSNISVGQNRHSSINTAASAIMSILADPDSANLGPNLIVPPAGFQTTLFGPDSVGSSSWSPTPAQFAAFFNALDSLDVLWIPNYSLIGTSITDSAQRNRLEHFIRTKGFVSTHNNTSSEGSWPAWDSIHGASIYNWSSEQNATLHLDTAAKGDPDLRFLNRGLPDTARFFEQWISFTTDGDEIRARSGLKVTVNIDESSIANMGTTRVMGDHPMSWYRHFPEGGRFFYTAIGHRSTTYLETGTAFLRRQLYNAVLWAAGVDSIGVSVRKTMPGERAGFADAARLTFSGGILTVSLLQNGTHTVEILALDGRRIDYRRDAARGDHNFVNPGPGVRLITVTSPAGRHTRLVTIP